LGRLNAFVADNHLGTGDFVGEKTTWASQKIVKELTAANQVPTKQIAASMRSYTQLQSLAGIDVFTMPTKVAIEGYQNLSGNFENQENEEFVVELSPDIDNEAVKLDKLWNVTDQEKKFALLLGRETPQNGEELVEMAQQMNCEDMFPILNKEELATIADDGKIPEYSRWANRIKNNEIAVDTLMNLAGLASFTNDQQAMDSRIRRLIS
jgi:transaldolase